MILGKYLVQNLEFKNTKVIDLGCGTGILSILLGMKGAKVLATDLMEA